MSALSSEALLDPKWAAWLNEPLDKFRNDEAALTAEIGPEETKKVGQLLQQKASERLKAYQEYQDEKRRAFAEIGAHPDANFKAVQAAYLKVQHKGLRKFLDKGEAKEAAIVAGAAIMGQGDPNPLPDLLKAKPQLQAEVGQDPEAFGLYMAARHAYLKAAANRDQIAQEMGGDYEVAQERLRQTLQEAYGKLSRLRAMLPTQKEEFALPPAPEAPRTGLVPRFQSEVARSLAPTLEKLAEMKGGDPSGVRGAIGAALPRPSVAGRTLGLPSPQGGSFLQALIEDFARYGLVEGPLFMGVGKVTGAAGLAPKVAAKVGKGLLGKAAGRAAEGAAILGGVSALSPASPTDPKERAKHVAASAAVGAVANPALGAVGDVAGAGLKKALISKPKGAKQLEPKVVDQAPETLISKPGQLGVVPKESTQKPAFLSKLEQSETPAASTPEPLTAKAPEGKTIGLKKEEIARVRENTGLDTLPEPTRKTWERTLSSAKDKGMDEKATTVASGVLKSSRAITDEEHAGMVLRAARVADEYEAAIGEAAKLVDEGNLGAAAQVRKTSEALLDELDVLTQASDLAGRETARSLAIRRMMVNRETYDIAHVMQRAKVAKGAKLTPEETAKYEQLVSKHETLKKDFDQLQTQYMESVAREEALQAQRVITRASRKAQITTRSKVATERLLKERESIKKELQALGFRVNDITGVTSEGAYLIGRLAVNYVRAGAKSLDEVVQLVRADIPTLAERDVHKALLAKDPKRIARARSEATRQIAEIKTQAKLLVELEKAEAGVFDPKVTRQRRTYSRDVQAMRQKLTALRSHAYKSVRDGERLEKSLQTINELQDQLANYYRQVKRRGVADTAELSSAKAKIAELRKEMRLDDEMANLQEQLRTGEFKVPVRETPKKLPPHLERKQIELRLAKKAIRRAIDDQKPLTPKGIIPEIADASRAIKATGEMSGVLRQGLFLSARRPVKAAKAFRKSVQAYWSTTKAEKIDADLRAMPEHYLREKAGLFLPSGEHRMGAREEYFESKIIDKIPGLREIVGASSRQMLTHLNVLRATMFDDFVRWYPNATDAELKAWADFVNKGSGRGSLGDFSQSAQALSKVFFAPRYAVSRFQTPAAIFKYWKEPRIRKQIAREYAANLTLGMTVLKIAEMNGLEVGIDPRDADFGKIVYKDTRIDIWAGFVQPARLLARLALVGTDRHGITTKPKRSKYEDEPIELLSRFSAYKLSPAVTTSYELATKKTIMGEETTPSETAVRAITPIIVESILEAYQEGSPEEAKVVAPASYFGIGTQTYKSKK